MNRSVPLIIGHRGSAGVAPENTLASFRRAVEEGSDALELDVHLTADRHIVVCHDYTLERTTDGIGEIARMTAAQLKQFDAGSWFHEQFAGERIPQLAEVFDAIPLDTMFNVELKGKVSADICGLLIGLLKEKERTDQVVVSSLPGKDVVYRFLNHSRFSWRRFLHALSLKIVAHFDSLTSASRVKAFIIDDSVINRNRSKKAELLARVHSVLLRLIS